MSVPDRRAMVERPGKDLSVRRQCALLSLARSGVYRPKPVAGGGRSGLDAPDRRIASRTAVLRLAANDVRTQQGRPRGQPQAGAKADARDGDRGAGSAPRHQQSRARPQDLSLSAARRGDHRAQSRLGGRHHLYSDGARLSVSGGDHRLGQPGGSGVAVVEHDGYGFCVAALDEALLRHGKPKIFNTDQGAQFTSAAFTGRLEAAGIAISMDGRGRFMDNIFIERLWRSIKYEEVHLKAYADGREARAGIGTWMNFYNHRRPHQAMNNQMPMAVWRASMDKIEAAEELWICRFAWTTQTRCPHTHSRRKSSSRSCLILKDKGRRDYTLNPAARGPTNGVHFRARPHLSRSLFTRSGTQFHSPFRVPLRHTFDFCPYLCSRCGSRFDA